MNLSSGAEGRAATARLAPRASSVRRRRRAARRRPGAGGAVRARQAAATADGVVAASSAVVADAGLVHQQAQVCKAARHAGGDVI